MNWCSLASYPGTTWERKSVSHVAWVHSLARLLHVVVHTDKHLFFINSGKILMLRYNYLCLSQLNREHWSWNLELALVSWCNLVRLLHEWASLSWGTIMWYYYSCPLHWMWRWLVSLNIYTVIIWSYIDTESITETLYILCEITCTPNFAVQNVMHLIEDLIKHCSKTMFRNRDFCNAKWTFLLPSRIFNLHDNATELYSQLTLNDSVTARPLSIVRETFNPSSLWGAAMWLVSSWNINMHRASVCLVMIINIKHN